VAKKVVVFDYGSGNVHSALKALEHAGASVTLTRIAQEPSTLTDSSFPEWERSKLS
jgi:imidazoleglycerol phosphate synthase glutamine amidotransferase subunit HisH